MGNGQNHAHTIAIAARKGGVGKTMTAVSLAAGISRRGKRVLVVDTDSQGSATVSFGINEPDRLTKTLASEMARHLTDQESNLLDTVIRTSENVDLIPGSGQLANIELGLVSAYARECVLRTMLSEAKTLYDYIILDTAPALSLLTINALSAADSAIIPVTPKYLDAKGLESLLRSISQIRREINPQLEILGILLTMVDKRVSLTKEISASIEQAYGADIHIFNDAIPRSVRAAETTVSGKSIFEYDTKGTVAAAYTSLVDEVLSYE